jgi:hypothetical protein
MLGVFVKLAHGFHLRFMAHTKCLSYQKQIRDIRPRSIQNTRRNMFGGPNQFTASIR